jgi:TolB-like protein
MKHILITLLLVVHSICALCQQDNKTIVGIVPVTGTGTNLSRDFLEEVTLRLTQGFIETHRFIVVDRSKFSLIDKERNLQKSESFIDGKVVEQGKSLGAQYIISGDVTHYTNDGQVCKMTISLSVLDVTTGHTIKSDVIDTKGGNHGKTVKRAGILGGALAVGSLVPGVGAVAGVAAGAAAASAGRDDGAGAHEKAFKKSLDAIYPQIQVFVSENFPATFAVVSIEKTTKSGKAAMLLVAGGRNMGVEEGQKMKLIKLQTLVVNGETMTRKKQIATAKVKKVDDDNFCTVAITDETEDVAAAIGAHEKIEATTIYED